MVFISHILSFFSVRPVTQPPLTNLMSPPEIEPSPSLRTRPIKEMGLDFLVRMRTPLYVRSKAGKKNIGSQVTFLKKIERSNTWTQERLYEHPVYYLLLKLYTYIFDYSVITLLPVTS